MNNLQQIKLALEYLEVHLTEDIQLIDIAKVVNFSAYHFHRMFRALTGFTLKDYTRRRRLYLAALDIVNDVDSLANIAQNYQFSSQSSFTVAFKQMHGLTPGEIRNGQDCKIFGRMALNDIELKRPNGLLKEPTLVELPSFSVIGLQCDVKYSHLLEVDNPLSKIWRDYHRQITLDDKTSLFAVYQYDPRQIHLEDMSFKYLLGHKVDDDITLPDHIVQKKVPESRYLLFQVNTANSSIFDIYDYIDEQWLPQSKYILSEKPDFEVHDISKSNLVEIYISIEE